MHKHFFNLLIFSLLFVGCAVSPVQTPQSDISKLATLLHALDKQTSKKESTKLSRDIFSKTSKLTDEFELTSPPIWHNFLVNVGLRKKGLCFHWSDALYLHLKQQHYADFSFHLVGANVGEYFFEHNALVVMSKGSKLEDGVIIDPWRNSGKLYFSKVKDDKAYTWVHRLDRGCAP
jgi:hypothetical protein